MTLFHYFQDSGKSQIEPDKFCGSVKNNLPENIQVNRISSQKFNGCLFKEVKTCCLWEERQEGNWKICVEKRNDTIYRKIKTKVSKLKWKQDPFLGKKVEGKLEKSKQGESCNLAPTISNVKRHFHQTWSKLRLVWNMKLLWKVVPFTWQLHCGQS